MALLEALNKAIHEFGKDVLTEPRLMNVLNDYHGFTDMPAARLALKIMLEEGYMSQLLATESLKNIAISQMPNKINKQFGFEVELIQKIINCILESSGNSFIPSSTNASNNANPSPPITKICEDDLRKYWIDDDGVQYTPNKKELVKADKSIKSYSIQKGTKVICERAFSECESLELISLPQKLTHIGESSFSLCKSLKYIILPKSLKYIGDYAFSWCLALRFVVFSGKVNLIGQHTFNRCFLNKIFIPRDSRSYYESILPKDYHKILVEGTELTTIMLNTNYSIDFNVIDSLMKTL